MAIRYYYKYLRMIDVHDMGINKVPGNNSIDGINPRQKLFLVRGLEQVLGLEARL